MIDNWAPKEKQPQPYVATGDRHANQTADECRHYRLKAKARVHRFGGRVKVMCMNSVDGARLVEDHSLDLVFLDADHSEPGLSADIKAWISKVKPGGYIGGHDFANTNPMANFTGVERAVRSWAEKHSREIELDNDFTWFCRC
jgi:predicted O-methyltransferase YrrM